jgi:hypothetical protein
MNVLVTEDRQIRLPLDEVVGTYRTFGRVGPAYEIVGVAGSDVGRHVMLRVRVLESGEELVYPLASALDDPLAE